MFHSILNTQQQPNTPISDDLTNSLFCRTANEIEKYRINDILSIIQSTTPPSEEIGQIIQHLKIKVGIQLLKKLFYVYLNENRDREFIELIGNIPPSHLQKMLQYDGQQTFLSLYKHGKEAIKQSKDKERMEKSVECEMNLFGLQKKQINTLDFSRKSPPRLEEMIKEREEKIQIITDTIKENCEDDAFSWSQRYLNNREVVTDKLLELRVFCKQRKAYFAWFKDAGLKVREAENDQELSKTIRTFINYHEDKAYSSREYLFKKIRIATSSPYSDEDIAKLKRLSKDTDLPLNEKKKVIVDLHKNVIARLVTEHKKDEATIQLLEQAFSGKTNGNVSEEVRTYIDSYEADISDSFQKIAQQYDSLMKVVQDESRFNIWLERAEHDKQQLEKRLIILHNRLEEITGLEKDIRRLIPQTSKEVRIWSEYYIDSYRLEREVSTFAFELLFWSRVPKHKLPKNTSLAIDSVQIGPALNTLSSMRRGQLISQLQGLSQSCRKDKKRGLHQLVAWQIQQVNRLLNNDRVYPKLEQSDKSDNNEDLQLVEKLISLECTPDIFSLEPFSIPKKVDSEGVIDWKAYIDVLQERGVHYEDIQKIKSYNDFIDYYLNERPYIQIARKVADLGLAPKGKKISKKEYLKNGKIIYEKGVRYDAIKDFSTEREYLRWMTKTPLIKELENLPIEMFEKITSQLSTENIESVRFINPHLYSVIRQEYNQD